MIMVVVVLFALLESKQASLQANDTISAVLASIHTSRYLSNSSQTKLRNVLI